MNFVIFVGNSGKRATVASQTKIIFTNEMSELANSRSAPGLPWSEQDKVRLVTLEIVMDAIEV